MQMTDDRASDESALRRFVADGFCRVYWDEVETLAGSWDSFVQDTEAAFNAYFEHKTNEHDYWSDQEIDIK